MSLKSTTVVIGTILLGAIALARLTPATAPIPVTPPASAFAMEMETENQLMKLTQQISKWRDDDIDRFCRQPSKAAIQEFEDRGGYLRPKEKVQADINFIIFEVYGGKCIAQHGWDDVSAPDALQQYNRITRRLIRHQWQGGQAWLEKHFADEDTSCRKQYADASTAARVCGE